MGLPSVQILPFREIYSILHHLAVGLTRHPRRLLNAAGSSQGLVVRPHSRSMHSFVHRIVREWAARMMLRLDVE